MVKTLKQIKEEVAKQYDFDSYSEMIDYEDGFDICIIDEIANRHAKEQLILHGVVGRSEQLVCQCNEPANWTTDEGFTGCVKCKKEVVGN